MAEAAKNADANDAAGNVTDEDKGTDSGKGAEEFDQERAMATIQKQRESEKAAKERAKELEAELAKYREAEDAKAEAEKALEVKVAERDATIAGLQDEIADLHVKQSFEQEALAKGIADPGLAYLAAKAQGVLGTYDPKVGEVGDHDWDKLAEKYPSFAAQESGTGNKTGDAGARGKGGTLSEAEQFNQAVRGAFGRR